MAELSKKGYVYKYRVERNMHPGSGDRWYYYVTITDDPAGTKPLELRLDRNLVVSATDIAPQGDPWIISLGNIDQAMIATLKDALLHGKQVTVYYEDLIIDHAHWFRLVKVELHSS